MCSDSRNRARRRSAWLGVSCATTIVASVVASAVACARPAESRDARDLRELRVCADPDNLPFSDARQEGFENRIAELVARDLHLPLRYAWTPQRRNFIGKTLGKGVCDVLIGVPVHSDRTLTTRPYYRSSYVFVWRQGAPFRVESFDDPVLRTARVGVPLAPDDYGNTPPSYALARRRIVKNVTGYVVVGDYTRSNPPARIIEAVAADDVDVAVAWGPVAGYYAGRERIPLAIAPVSPQVDRPYLPMAFDIAMAVRQRDTTLQRALDGVIARRQGEIDRILDSYHIPYSTPRGAAAGAVAAQGGGV